MVVFFLLFFLLLSSSAAFAEVPISIDLTQGGAITSVLLDGVNVVDTNDCGRLIQLALYDKDLPRTVAGFSCLPQNADYTFPWDPVQACDGCVPPHMTRIIDGIDKSYIKFRPLLWAGNGREGDFAVEQRISQTEFSNAVKVNYKIIHEGNDSHKKLSIELPATWINNKYSKFVYYNGNNPWTNDSLKETYNDLNQSTEQWLGMESWGALVNPSSNRGIGVYNPASLVAKSYSPNPGGAVNHPRYSTDWMLMEVPPHSEFSYDIYILTGSVEEIRSTVYKLPRNNNFSVEPVGDIPKLAKRGETLSIPVKVTNKTLVAFHKDDNKPDYEKTFIKVKGISEDWIPITSNVMPGQSIVMNLPVKVPSEGGKYKYVFDVLNRWWLVMSGFPEYSFVLEAVDSVPTVTPQPTSTPNSQPTPLLTPDLGLRFLGRGWNKVRVVNGVVGCGSSVNAEGWWRADFPNSLGLKEGNFFIRCTSEKNS